MAVDPGLQHERTILAWERTAGCFLANIALVLVRVGESIDPLEIAAAAMGLIATLGFAGAARWRRIKVSPLPTHAVAILALLTTVFACTVLVSITI